MNKAKYILFRTVQTVALLFGIMAFLFFFFRLLPGDYTGVMLFQGASEETVAQFEQKWGLNDPLYVQFWNYLVNFLNLDFGISRQYNKPVLDHVAPKIFNSFILIAPAITFSYIVGAILGSLFGSNRGSKKEQIGITSVIFAGSFPSFFIAILFLLVFASWLSLFPISGMFSPETTIRYSEAAWWRPYLTIDFLIHYMLPFSTIVIRYLTFPTLIMRTSVVEVMDQNFTFYRKMTGVTRMRQLYHVGKHASLPVITLYPVSMTRALGGLVLIEIVFNWPGIGATLVEGVLSRDFPVVQFVFFIIASFVVIANFVVDIVYGVIDPRVSIEGPES